MVHRFRASTKKVRMLAVSRWNHSRYLWPGEHDRILAYLSIRHNVGFKESLMLSPQEFFSSLHQQVTQILPDVGKYAQEDITAQLKIMVSGIISKLDLVSREEFDAQQAVLLHTREKLEALEARFALLEKKLEQASED
jgi:BMFP domain-containing protein YqiC